MAPFFLPWQRIESGKPTSSSPTLHHSWTRERVWVFQRPSLLRPGFELKNSSNLLYLPTSSLAETCKIFRNMQYQCFFAKGWHFKREQSVFWKAPSLQNKDWLRARTSFVYKTSRLVRISLLIRALNKRALLFFSWKLFHKSKRKLFTCLCISWYKHSRGWKNSRQLCKPSTSSRVCITVSNSTNPSRVYIRLCLEMELLAELYIEAGRNLSTVFWKTEPKMGDTLLNKLYSTNKFVSRWSPPLCNDQFLAGCTFSYNWIHPLKNATVEMNQRNFLPINTTRVLVALANVIQPPHMNNKNSVILLNHGLHFITSTNFST